MTTLEELEKLREAATPGPWVYRPERFDDWGTIRATPLPGEVVGGFVAFARAGNNHLTEDHFAEHRANKTDPYYHNAALIVAAINALPELIESARRVEEMQAALADMSDCQPLPKIYKYTGTAEVDVENMFDVGHRHANGRKPYDYLKSWLSMLRPFAYATQDDSWGEMEKLLSIVMNNYVQTLVKAEAARTLLKGT